MRFALSTKHQASDMEDRNKHNAAMRRIELREHELKLIERDACEQEQVQTESRAKSLITHAHYQESM